MRTAVFVSAKNHLNIRTAVFVLAKIISISGLLPLFWHKSYEYEDCCLCIGKNHLNIRTAVFVLAKII